MKHSPGFLKIVEKSRKKVGEATVAEVKAKLRRRDRFLLVDVREEHEWIASHIPGSLYLGKGIIERDIEKTVPDKRTEIVLYCGGGFRSVLAAESLKKMGYRNVSSMAGGWRAWKRSGGRTER